ncbi:hypothetical protein BS47DRAFT_1352693 [Hydnum rufescens UP504]|uniref:Uncharacterized protein n=1 Tax=Hydnum rufescens UP504 TaxID=1448309 RepID=A0A9P6AJK9_9AGAM|nr:hypothetical protein BS47DRAFT_1352693 [Hydnum rufescens UP504]
MSCTHRRDPETSQTTTLSSPVSSGTAQPPFQSRPVTSGTIIQYSEFTATGYPTSAGSGPGASTSAKSGSGAMSTLQPANLYLANLGTISSVIIALMGGGVLWAL